MTELELIVREKLLKSIVAHDFERGKSLLINLALDAQALGELHYSQGVFQPPKVFEEFLYLKSNWLVGQQEAAGIINDFRSVEILSALEAGYIMYESGCIEYGEDLIADAGLQARDLGERNFHEEILQPPNLFFSYPYLLNQWDEGKLDAVDKNIR